MQWPAEIKEELKRGMQPLVPKPSFSEDDVINFILDEFGAATVLRAQGIPENMAWAAESIPTTLGAVTTGVLLNEEIVEVASFNQQWHPAVQKLFQYTRNNAAAICDAYRNHPSRYAQEIHEEGLKFWGEGESGQNT